MPSKRLPVRYTMALGCVCCLLIVSGYLAYARYFKTYAFAYEGLSFRHLASQAVTADQEGQRLQVGKHLSIGFSMPMSMGIAGVPSQEGMTDVKGGSGAPAAFPGATYDSLTIGTNVFYRLKPQASASGMAMQAPAASPTGLTLLYPVPGGQVSVTFDDAFRSEAEAVLATFSAK